MRKIIIDCDPGVDDALAIFLALASPEVEVLGITCVKGNVPVEKTFRNARRLLAAAGRLDIPVLQGMDRPLLAPADLYASVHGEDGLCGVDLADPPAGPDLPHAVSFISQMAARHPGEITLCPIGPMTNVAMALRLDPALAGNLHSIAFMGGAAFVPGNMNDFAEFNILIDPHAAEIVMQSGVPLIMYGLDVTLQALITPDRLAAIRRIDTRCARLSAEMLQGYTAGDLHLHDPCVIAGLIDPSLFSGQRCAVRVVTDSGEEFGRTIALPDPEGSCLVMTGADVPRLFDLVLSGLARLA